MTILARLDKIGSASKLSSPGASTFKLPINPYLGIAGNSQGHIRIIRLQGRIETGYLAICYIYSRLIAFIK